MKLSHLSIEHFRGLRSASLLLPSHAVLIGDNNTGKSTVLEAMDLILGPDRLSRPSPIDEHDFYLGAYLAPKAEGAPWVNAADHAPPQITITGTITDLSEEQRIHFGDYIEWWDNSKQEFYNRPDPRGLDASPAIPSLRVTFVGRYDPEEDDFEGKTFYTRSLHESESPQPFTKRDKQKCGFLYLRPIRTGTRALSLEKGTLLDVILRLKEIRPKMWEATLAELSSFDVASDTSQTLAGQTPCRSAPARQTSKQAATHDDHARCGSPQVQIRAPMSGSFSTRTVSEYVR